MADPRYKRLTRSYPRSAMGIISVSRASLWLGPDHLLCIDTSGYTENYKRFYYRDIQAVLFRKTNFWMIRWLLFLTLSLLFGSLVILVPMNEAKWVLGILGGIFVLALIFELIAGPTCACFLRTAVQVEELPSLNRLRRGRNALKKLRPLIVEAQGQLTPEELHQRMSEAGAGAQAPSTAVPAAMASSTPASPLSETRGLTPGIEPSATAGGAATTPSSDDPNVPPRLSS